MTMQSWLKGLFIISVSLFIAALLVVYAVFGLRLVGDSAAVVPMPIVVHSKKKVAQLPLLSDAQIPSNVPHYTLPPVVNGIPPLITTIPTKEPVVFLTIDDGAYKDPSVVQMIKDNHIVASLYISKLFIGDNPDFFKQIVASGSLIEDHTLSHHTRMITEMTYEQQKAEICGMADYEQQEYGRRPIFFRPPGGAYSETLLRAAGACGMRAVVTWIAKANGGSMQYQIGNKLRPGDVVLMHFRPEFKKDMQAFIDAETAAGLHTELFENWVG